MGDGRIGGRESRVRREKKTIGAMVRLYCRGNHDGTKELCAECQGLLTYAFARLDKCPFMGDKPTCAKCTVHCYERTMRDRVRKVMRYSGPRMMLHHPVLALGHSLDGARKPARRTR